MEQMKREILETYGLCRSTHSRVLEKMTRAQLERLGRILGVETQGHFEVLVERVQDGLRRA